MPITEDRDAVIHKISSFPVPDRDRILGALELAAKSDSPPGAANCICAASLLLDLGMDSGTIIAALVHLLPRSSAEEFGPAVVSLAGNVVKIENVKTNTRSIREAKDVRNMIFALTEDIRAVFIVIAVKLAMLRAMDFFPENSAGDPETVSGGPQSLAGRRKAAARECLDIFAPIADRLGISSVKNEMEDISLKILNRETYQQIKNLVAEKRDERNRFLRQIQDDLRNEANSAGIKIDTESRAKHFYSVYMKMRKRGVSAEKIHDLSGIRVICDSIENCYIMLGIVHRLWKPLGGCFKDYIANPKPNGYQSLHTTVTIAQEPDRDSGRPERTLEIQIRTKEMHRIAEYGVASHWLYKKGSSRDIVLPDDLGAVNKLRDWKQGSPDGGGFSFLWLQDIRDEILRSWVYVFTPQGKVVKLPAGSTAIDFAYSVHTTVGEHCSGAKANGAIIPLSAPLKNTQVVEILTSQTAHPHFNWLELAKSSRARGKIRSWLRINDESFRPEKTEEAKPKTADDLPEVSDLLPVPDVQNEVRKIIHPPGSVLHVSVENEKNMMIRFARCCNPLPGDLITGYVSRGRGVIIHRSDCLSLANNIESVNRRIEVEWDNAETMLIKRFRVEVKYSPSFFSDIEGAVRKRQGHLIEGRLEELKDNVITGVFAVQLLKAGDLRPVLRNIRLIPGILKIDIIA